MLNFFNYYGFFPNWISTFFVIFRQSAVEVTCDHNIPLGKIFKLIFKFFQKRDATAPSFGSFCRYRKALFFWSLGISLYLELFCFLSFITIVLRNLCSGTHRKNPSFLDRIKSKKTKYLPVPKYLPLPSSLANYHC